MMHPDDETIVEFALAHVDDPSLEAHLLTCARCRTELEQTELVISAAQGLEHGAIELESPPGRVWAAINGELSADTWHEPTRSPGTRTWWRPALGAAAGFAVGVAATVAVVVLADDQQPPQSSTIASGTIEPFEGQGSTNGKAVVLRANGNRSVRIVLSTAPSGGDDFVEAWIFDPRTNGMVALGVMDKASETFAIPTSLDLATYDSIDLSLEPYDGNPAHSEISIAHATLDQL